MKTRNGDGCLKELGREWISLTVSRERRMGSAFPGEDIQRFGGNLSSAKEDHLLLVLRIKREIVHGRGLCSPKNSTKVKDGSY